MEFRLVYKGAIPAQTSGGGGTRVHEKHDIRLAMHEQLRTLWCEHSVLRDYDQASLETLANNWQRCNMRFIPLVSNKAGLACALDILFLRRDPPGTPIITGGDLDNRLKVLLDGLRMPTECGEIPARWQPGPAQNPLFCLMENDNLITEIRVTSDRLLSPLKVDEHRHEVELVIHVTTKILKPWILSFDGAPQV